MKKSKFTEAQILFALQQGESGVMAEGVRRKLGISEATFYIRKKRQWTRAPSSCGACGSRKKRTRS